MQNSLLTMPIYGWRAECKGQAQAIATNTENFSQQLQGIFNQQFATQQAALGSLTETLNKMATDPQGYSSMGLAAMQTQATQGNAQQFSNAQQLLNQQISTMQGGAAGLPSGAAAMLEGQLQNSAYANQSNALLGIAKNNADLQVQQQQAALNELPGVINAQGQLPGSASSVLQSQNNAFNQQNAIVSPWMKLLQTAVGAAVGGFTGGLGNKLGGSIFGNSGNSPSNVNAFNSSTNALLSDSGVNPFGLSMPVGGQYQPNVSPVGAMANPSAAGFGAPNTSQLQSPLGPSTQGLGG